MSTNILFFDGLKTVKWLQLYKQLSRVHKDYKLYKGFSTAMETFVMWSFSFYLLYFPNVLFSFSFPYKRVRKSLQQVTFLTLNSQCRGSTCGLLFLSTAAGSKRSLYDRTLEWQRKWSYLLHKGLIKIKLLYSLQCLAWKRIFILQDFFNKSSSSGYSKAQRAQGREVHTPVWLMPEGR